MSADDALSALFGGIAQGARFYSERAYKEEQDRKEEEKARRLEADADRRYMERLKLKAQTEPPQQITRRETDADGYPVEVTGDWQPNYDEPSQSQFVERARQRIAPPKPGLHTVGNALVDDTGKAIYTAPEKPREASESEREWAQYQRMSPEQRALYDKMKGRTTANPFGDIGAAAAGGFITPEEAAAAVRRKTGVDVPVPPVTVEARNKLALIDNALTNARKFQERTVVKNAKGEVTAFKDIASMTDDTPQLMKSAIQDMLYAKSGASAPDAEVEKAYAMFAPAGSLRVPVPFTKGIPTGIPTEWDATAAAKVQNFIDDMERMRAEIAGENERHANTGAIPSRKKVTDEHDVGDGFTVRRIK